MRNYYMSQVISQEILQVLRLVSSQIGKTVGVPRGLLRFLVLKMLNEKPMSGTEIAEQIKDQTGGRWKPSSGSIYPLLAWMLKKGFTKESLKGVDGLKRYSFTIEGSKFLKKQIQLGQDFLTKMEFLLPMLIGGLQFGSSNEKLREAKEPARQLVSAFMTIRHNLDDLSQRDAQEIVQTLTECSQKLEKIAKRTKNEDKTQSV
jgi:DNA-binding PadR family transcriptional regulator